MENIKKSELVDLKTKLIKDIVNRKQIDSDAPDLFTMLHDYDEEVKKLNLRCVRNWVSCKDKMPEHQSVVLIYYHEGTDILQFMDGDWFHYEEGNVTNRNITHWMPLPEPPKQE